MQQKKPLIYSDKKFLDFLDKREKLSPFDQKLEAGLLLEKSEAIDIDKAFSEVTKRINRETKIYNIKAVIIKFAAILTLPLLAFTIWSLFFLDKSEEGYSRISQNEITWQEVTSPYGMRSHLVLPDGTNLWLNAGSKLRYGIPFMGKTREVELEGEAFLDVFEDRYSPFVIKSGNFVVEVTGTQFNFKSYPGSDNIEVALKS
ncbi:MAG: FecR domain-containing protein, partial [Prolixibacteraceae bacterium]|nr:FecR domain-containing protein [Prolixibacteraceae bacterium]